MIHLNDIHYRYPKRQDWALEAVSFDVQPGEIFCLLGPNGAGKTTLIRVLSGLILRRQGDVAVCGYGACAAAGLTVTLVGCTLSWVFSL